MAKCVLITGSNTGIGFEAAAQFADEGYEKVILTCRTMTKADDAIARLIERTGKSVFEGIVLDTSEPESAHKAVNVLLEKDISIDVLVLNAGMSTGTNPAHNSNGVELTFASTLIGHHVLTMRLLAEGLLTKNARIVIAGSEAATGSYSGASIPDFYTFAEQHFAGDIEQGLTRIARVEAPYEDQFMNVYSAAKVYVAWWASALSRRLPDGMIVNAVSPGGVPNTGFMRHAPAPIRFMMMRVMPFVGAWMGLAGPIENAARRYLTVANFDNKITGQFFASPEGKAVGKLEQKKQAHFFDETLQEACWNVIVNFTGIDYPA